MYHIHLDHTLQLLFILFINFLFFFFKSSDCLWVVFISLSQSLHWRRREQSSKWLLDRRTGCCCFVVLSLLRSFSMSFHMCSCYSSIRCAHCGNYLKAAFISFSMCGDAATSQEWLLIESSLWSSQYGCICWCTWKRMFTNHKLCFLHK